MTKKIHYSHIYGFDDYKLVGIGDEILYNSLYTYYFEAPYNYLISEHLPVKIVQDNFSYSTIPPIRDNRNILIDAKKLYTHPCCTLSRSLIAEKYKKSLNPWLSDAVVIPSPDFNHCYINEYALFINDEDKIIVKMPYSDGIAKKLKDIPMNTLFKDVFFIDPNIVSSRREFSIPAVNSSRLFYIGELYQIHEKDSHLFDILSGSLPLDKIVFEESVQKSLGNDSNKLDYESLTSIRDMLESTDDDTVSTGLKTLSMMDWIHYSESVKYVLTYVPGYHWIYNKACNSVSVKSMLGSLFSGRSRRHWNSNYSISIYKDDYELLKQLIMNWENIPETKLFNTLYNFSFAYINSEGVIDINTKTD